MIQCNVTVHEALNRDNLSKKCFHTRPSILKKKLSFEVHAFFVSNTFISNARLKLAKNQVKAKQHPETELLLFENKSHSSSKLSSKNNSKKCKKNKCICFNEVI